MARREVQKILVIKLSALGDFVLALAAMSAMYCWCRVTSSRLPSRPMWPPMKCFHG